MIVFRLTLGKTKYELELPKELSTMAFAEALTDWLTHKQEKKSSYKHTGFKALINRLAELGEKRAIAAINYSMSQGYQGIWEEKVAPGRVFPEAPRARPAPKVFVPTVEEDFVTPEKARSSIDAIPEELQKRFGLGKFSGGS